MPGKLVHPLLSVTVTEYVPLAAVVTLEIVGVLLFEVKLFGPVHEYVDPPPAFGVLKEIDPPSHKLLGLAEAVGIAGLELITTTVFEVLVQPLASVTVKV